jgi:putative DNA primase/helicase
MDRVEKKDTSKEDFDAQANVWKQSVKPEAGGIVQQYLTGRLGFYPGGLQNVRQMDEIMIARVADKDDKGVNIHRTFLFERPDRSIGCKEKKVMKGSIPRGSAIRLFPPAKVLGVAEGIETALSAASLFGVPVWSTISAVGMHSWIPPEETETVVIYGDNDANYAGQAAAYALAHRLVNEYKKTVEVRIPPVTGWDWNDALKVRPQS